MQEKKGFSLAGTAYAEPWNEGPGVLGTASTWQEAGLID